MSPEEDVEGMREAAVAVGITITVDTMMLPCAAEMTSTLPPPEAITRMTNSETIREALPA